MSRSAVWKTKGLADLDSDIWRLCQVAFSDDVQWDSSLLLTHRALRLGQLHGGPAQFKPAETRSSTVKTELLNQDVINNQRYSVFLTCERAQCSLKDQTLWTQGCLRETPCLGWWCRQWFSCSAPSERSTVVQNHLQEQRERRFNCKLSCNLDGNKTYFLTCDHVLQVTKVGLADNAEHQLFFSAVAVLGLQLTRWQKDAVSSVA